MNDNILYKHKSNSTLILNPSNVYILNELLSLTYDYDMVDYTLPTNIYPTVPWSEGALSVGSFDPTPSNAASGYISNIGFAVRIYNQTQKNAGASIRKINAPSGWKFTDVHGWETGGISNIKVGVMDGNTQINIYVNASFVPVDTNIEVVGFLTMTKN
mgnify:CR=1 FL=1